MVGLEQDIRLEDLDGEERGCNHCGSFGECLAGCDCGGCEDTRVYCKGCVLRNIELGITDAESCALLVPYEGDEVCSECCIHPATLAEPEEDDSN